MFLIIPMLVELADAEKVFHFNSQNKNKMKEELSEDELLEKVTTTDYKYGFTTNIQSDKIEKGINENIIRLISEKKNEPEWMLEFRLQAFKTWLEMDEPDWANIDYPKPD